MAAWLDSKDAILQVLMQGYQEYGFGIDPLNVQPLDNEHPILYFYRAQGQEIANRPVLVVSRQGGSGESRWLGNLAVPAAGTTEVVPTFSVPLEQTFRVSIGATNDTGGQSVCDWLIELASNILTQAYQVLTWPIEAGGYGFYFPSWQLLSDGLDPFTQASGKVLFKSGFDLTFSRLPAYSAGVSPTDISGFAIQPTVAVSTTI